MIFEMASAVNTPPDRRVALKPYEFLAHRWRVVNVDGQKVLLLAVHSSECSDDIGPCYRAFVWQDVFRTATRAYE